MTANGNQLVIANGFACLDQLLIWEDTSLPVQGNRVTGNSMQGGGMAATAMVAVSRLGGQAELWAIVSDDWVGNAIVEGLQADGVDTSQMQTNGEMGNLLLVVCVDRKSGDRYFVSAGGNFKRPDVLVGDLSRLAGAGCLLIDHALPSSELRAAKEARRLGVPVVSDTGRFNTWHEEIYPYIDYAIVSEYGANSLHEDVETACRMIRDRGAGTVVVTLGNKGLVYLDGDTFGRLPAFPVEVVDTTGAGDVFHGAFCYGLTQGFALEQNLRFASAVSAIKCRRLGGRAGIPTRAEVDAFLGEWDTNRTLITMD